MRSEIARPNAPVSDRGKKRQDRRRIILGIDPGVSTGLAVLDLDGDCLFAKSEREISWERIVNEVSRYGKVVLVATDVTPAPDLARKLASALRATLFTPNKPIEVSEKRTLVDKYGESNVNEAGNPHARDALASAIKALLQFKSRFERIENEMAEAPAPFKERTKELLVKGTSINRAMRESRWQPLPIKHSALGTRFSHIKPELQERVNEQAHVIARLEGRVQSLLEEIERLGLENRELRNSLERERARSDIELRRDRLCKAQENQIMKLTRRLRQLQEKLGLVERQKMLGESHAEAGAGMTMLKPIESFSSDGLEKAEARFRIEPGDPIILLNASGGGASTARMLVKLRPSIVVTCTSMAGQAEEVLIQNGIPVVKSDILAVRSIRDKLFVPTKDVELAISRQKSLMRVRVKAMLEDTIESCHG